MILEISGNENDRHHRKALSKFHREGQTITLGHVEIDNDKVDRLIFDNRQVTIGARCFDDFPALLESSYRLLHHDASELAVVDDQNGRFAPLAPIILDNVE